MKKHTDWINNAVFHAGIGLSETSKAAATLGGEFVVPGALPGRLSGAAGNRPMAHLLTKLLSSTVIEAFPIS